MNISLLQLFRKGTELLYSKAIISLGKLVFAETLYKQNQTYLQKSEITSKQAQNV